MATFTLELIPAEQAVANELICHQCGDLARVLWHAESTVVVPVADCGAHMLADSVRVALTV